MFEGLSDLIRKQLSVRGPGEFVVPGLVKLRVVKKPNQADIDADRDRIRPH